MQLVKCAMLAERGYKETTSPADQDDGRYIICYITKESMWIV